LSRKQVCEISGKNSCKTHCIFNILRADAVDFPMKRELKLKPYQMPHFEKFTDAVDFPMKRELKLSLTQV
jgi:hypothetical protein